MNKIVIYDIQILKNKIIYNYEVCGEWTKYFNLGNKLNIEYSELIEDIPMGVAVIPLLCNILPIAWVCDAEIILDDLDQEFYNSINEFKKGYIGMYPRIEFLGKVCPKKIIRYNNKREEKNSLTLFSGGVDAFHTLFSNIEENPSIVTIWGADINLDDIEGWSKVLNHTVETATLNSLDSMWIKSNFRTFIDEKKLNEKVKEKADDGWWHGFQHGIGLIGHTTPFVYKYQIDKVYIAASFTTSEKGKVTCASDPTIDNYVKFLNCSVIHDGYHTSRQEKIKFLCDYSETNSVEIPIRVCWESKGGTNCCKCEKCYRTIFGILAEKADPRKYGFNYTDEEFSIIVRDLKYRIYGRVSNWRYIQNRFKDNYTVEELDKSLHWFYKMDIEKFNYTPQKNMFRVKRKLTQILSRKK